ncbi:hypothetical protein Mgra_00002894 [Meloidogyne graminicola]|uniref:Uncharacterized protein n=1 Tax=Meloidogyne graminicola TaxID=189291 RepID=A0A8S9ZWF9_9BILA|nr:hypothetical protein Mgra_00002894 [Meloidogyne graminicola]
MPKKRKQINIFFNFKICLAIIILIDSKQHLLFSSLFFASSENNTSAKELFNWLNYQNESNYSPISPSSPELLIKLDNTKKEINGLSLSQIISSSINLIETENDKINKIIIIE